MFGEPLPIEFIKNKNLIEQADLVIVAGTALAVSPFNSLVTMVPDAPKVLLNMENLAHYGFDFTTGNRLCMEGKCDDLVKEIVKECGWEEEL